MNKLQREDYTDLSISKYELQQRFNNYHKEVSTWDASWSVYLALEFNKDVEKHNMEVKNKFPKNAELLANFIIFS